MSTSDHTATGHTVTDRAGTDGAAPQHPPSSRRRGLSWWQAIAAAAVAATVVNLLILLIGRVAGASFEVVDGAGLHMVSAAGVITSSVAPLVIGTVLAALLGLWWPGFVRLAQVIGGGLALLTVAGPMMSDTDIGTQLALASMHVVVAVAVVLGLEPVRRWAKARRTR